MPGSKKSYSNDVRRLDYILKIKLQQQQTQSRYLLKQHVQKHNWSLNNKSHHSNKRKDYYGVFTNLGTHYLVRVPPFDHFSLAIHVLQLGIDVIFD